MTSLEPSPLIVGTKTFEALRSLVSSPKVPPAPEKAICTPDPFASEERPRLEPAPMVTLPAPVSAPAWTNVAPAPMTALPSTSSVPPSVRRWPGPTFSVPLSTIVGAVKDPASVTVLPASMVIVPAAAPPVAPISIDDVASAESVMPLPYTSSCSDASWTVAPSEAKI